MKGTVERNVSAELHSPRCTPKLVLVHKRVVLGTPILYEAICKIYVALGPGRSLQSRCWNNWVFATNGRICLGSVIQQTVSEIASVRTNN